MLISTLGRIESHNPRLGAVTEIMEQHARQEAARIDAQREHGETVGPLAGLPITVKEIIDTTPAPCSAGLPFLRNYRPAQDAERSEERSVGKECVSTCRYRWSSYHSKKKKMRKNK